MILYMGNDFARSINAPYLFGGDGMDKCSLGEYYYKTLGEARSPIKVDCCKCGCSGEKSKLYAIPVFQGTKNESILLFHFAQDDITTTYSQKLGVSADKDGPKASGELSKTVTIKKGSPLVKMILVGNADKNPKSIEEMYSTYCVDCILKDSEQKSRIKSILLHVNGNGFIINSDYKIVSPSYGDSK